MLHKNSFFAGMQGYPIIAGEARALPIHMSTLAERLLGLGYNTHLVGKWHLGHENRSVTPTGRGFQSHLGYWGGFVGYFDYEIAALNVCKCHLKLYIKLDYSGR